MHLNLLLQSAPNPFFPGMWRSPEDESALGYRTLDFWRNIVGTAERGGFHSVIFESTDAVPRLDPLMLLSALAASTTHIGLVASPDTARLPPALIAEQLSSLDHISDGRIGWRIDDVAPADVAAAVALWETSWDANAMVFDTARNEMLKQDRVQAIGDLGVHPTEPSQQRTPTLVAQADGANGPALAEVLLVDPVPVSNCRAAVDAIFDDADAADRAFDEVRLVMTARTLVGVDGHQVSQLKRHIDRHAGEGTAESMPFVGTGAEVADQMQHYLDAGLHGFSLVTAPLPGGLKLIVDHLVPELRHRKLLPEAYAASTLREHYFGFDQRALGPDHPARRG